MKQNPVHPVHTVTPVSKILAAVLFITLPFLGFFLGINYQRGMEKAVAKTVIVKEATNRTPVVQEEPEVEITDGILP